ncbi:pirin-like C-terminal cupin domain-containing protein [Acidithiobacillus ferridurans]|uniref:pirin-like C-terminal cupin domain-containing protein n=1 Tax=Acidithiobacillus ferridurans TaxID=1232575 RepID=UPI0018D569C2
MHEPFVQHGPFVMNTREEMAPRQIEWVDPVPMGPGKGCMGRCMDIVNRRRHSPCRPKHTVVKQVVPRQCLT